jgi:multidrug efflux system membrane fusion protein
VPVAVAAVEQKAMPVQVQAIGTVEPLSQVTVRAQVGGELMRVHIKEGQDVRKGELLFTIDPRTAEAALAQAQANLAKDRVQVQQARATLARDQAQARNADVQAKRYAELLKKDLVSREQHDQIQTTAESMAATVRADEEAIRSAEQLVRADQATVDNAKVQLGYTVIRSPLDGRTGSLGLNAGNVVRANDSALIVINQIQPIYVSFTVPQQQLPAIKRYAAEGTLQVQVLPSGDPRPVTGSVTFIDNTVDPTTGTIRLKATFANEEKRLWPGQFVNVTLTLTTDPAAIVIPAQAVQSGQQGSQYVFVVKEDSTVDNRRIAVERTQGNETVVAKGLAPGEKVVTDGQPRLTPGAKVEVRVPGAPGEGGPGGGPGRGDRPGGKRGGDGEKGSGARGGEGEKGGPRGGEGEKVEGAKGAPAPEQSAGGPGGSGKSGRRRPPGGAEGTGAPGAPSGERK